MFIFIIDYDPVAHWMIDSSSCRDFCPRILPDSASEHVWHQQFVGQKKIFKPPCDCHHHPTEMKWLRKLSNPQNLKLRILESLIRMCQENYDTRPRVALRHSRSDRSVSIVVLYAQGVPMCSVHLICSNWMLTILMHIMLISFKNGHCIYLKLHK